MKIVKFKDGKYGIRKFRFSELGWVYKDLGLVNSENNHWWSKNGNHFLTECRGDFEKVWSIWNEVSDSGTALNEKSLQKELFHHRLKNGDKKPSQTEEYSARQANERHTK